MSIFVTRIRRNVTTQRAGRKTALPSTPMGKSNSPWGYIRESGKSRLLSMPPVANSHTGTAAIDLGEIHGIAAVADTGQALIVTGCTVASMGQKMKQRDL